MKRCPKCDRFGLEYDPQLKKERCLWNDCLWVNTDNLDTETYFEVKTAVHGTKFKKFAESLEDKNDNSAQ